MFYNWLWIIIFSLILTCQQTQSLLAPGVKLYKYMRWYFKLISKMYYTTTRRYWSMVKITKTNKQRINLCYLPLAFKELKPTWHHLLSPETVCLTSPLTAFACFLPCLSYPCPPLCLPFAPSRASFVWMDTSKAGTWERKGLIST